MKIFNIKHLEIMNIFYGKQEEIKRISIGNGKIFLVPENDSFKKIRITEEMDFDIWCVVTYVIHKV